MWRPYHNYPLKFTSYVHLSFLGVVRICSFSSLITLFSLPITQKWWVPRLSSLFGCAFSFYFHHSILWFLSDELWKLKTHFKCFQVIKTEFPWHFGNKTHVGVTHCQREVTLAQLLRIPPTTFSFRPKCNPHKLSIPNSKHSSHFWTLSPATPTKPPP